MTWLVMGLLLWVGLHFVPSLGRGLRGALIERLGEKRYRGLFTVGVILSIVLMVVGWRSAAQWSVYEPPLWGRPVGMLLILIGFLLFGFAKAKTNVKQFLRHPQLMGLVAWAVGHLLANGDNLSLVLFGGLGLWALIEMPLISGREGAWQKPDPVPVSAEIKPIVIGVVIFVVFLVAHPYLFGVSPIPG